MCVSCDRRHAPAPSPKPTILEARSVLAEHCESGSLKPCRTPDTQGRFDPRLPNDRE
jgi:hypothetical protein